MLVLTAVQYDVRKNEQKRHNLAIRDLKLLSNIKHLQQLACAEDLIHSHINGNGNRKGERVKTYWWK